MQRDVLYSFLLDHMVSECTGVLYLRVLGH